MKRGFEKGLEDRLHCTQVSPSILGPSQQSSQAALTVCQERHSMARTRSWSDNPHGLENATLVKQDTPCRKLNPRRPRLLDHKSTLYHLANRDPPVIHTLHKH